MLQLRRRLVPSIHTKVAFSNEETPFLFGTAHSPPNTPSAHHEGVFAKDPSSETWSFSDMFPNSSVPTSYPRMTRFLTGLVMVDFFWSWNHDTFGGHFDGSRSA